MAETANTCCKCLHVNVCEILTCHQCSSGWGCDDCEIYNANGGKPDKENCEHFQPADSIVRHGHWIECRISVIGRIVIREKCSNCEHINLVKDKFCPNCGCNMDEEATQ